MPVLRQIALLGHPVLRQIAAPPLAVPDPGLDAFSQDLLATLMESGGVGIAAPQVFVSERVIVVASRPNARYPQAPVMEPLVMVNPELVATGSETELGWEGCLSVPGLRGQVPRHRTVSVVYQDLSGSRRELDLEGFPARIFQHELDHLNGLFFLDRVEDNRHLVSEQEYLRRFV